MDDRLDREQRSENMRRIRSANTKPEVFVRKTLTKMGYRYRLSIGRLYRESPISSFPVERKSSLSTGAFGTCMSSVAKEEFPTLEKSTGSRSFVETQNEINAIDLRSLS